MARPTIPEVLPQFAAYYDRVGWNSLHIVLDDGNVLDSHVQFCIGWAEENKDSEGKRLAELLLTMSRTQRAKLPHAVNVYLSRR
jgi:hypothetical protein